MNVGLLKTTLVNYPGRVAAAVFLPGCNLRCPFCHNGELATASVVSGPHLNHQANNEYIPLEEAYSHLVKRASVLSGFTISGGEPLLSPVLNDLIQKAKGLGLAVKIDTNGTLPDRLESILKNKYTRPNMIALDIKTSPDRYGELTIERNYNNFAGNSLLRTLAILEEPSTFENIRIEYRTVLIPALVGDNEILEIAALLPKNADWQLAQFVPGNCLDPTWNSIEPYGNAETKHLVSLAKTRINGATFR